MRAAFARHLELALYRSYADLKSEILQTYMGVLWWIIEPITSMFIYYFVFKTVLRVHTEDFIPFLLIGVVMWRWFAASVQVGANAIIRNRGLIQQAPVHALVYPAVEFFENTFKFLVSLLVLLVFLWVYGYGIQAHYLMLPLILLIEMFFIFGIMLPLCAVVPFLPDIASVIPHAIRIGFYASAVLFPPDRIPEQWRWVVDYNPMAVIIASSRDVLMYNRWPTMSCQFLGVALASLALAILGAFLVHWFNEIYGKRIIE